MFSINYVFSFREFPDNNELSRDDTPVTGSMLTFRKLLSKTACISRHRERCVLTRITAGVGLAKTISLNMDFYYHYYLGT
jgi:hypothetical protein